jgi:hypothetical protein
MSGRGSSTSSGIQAKDVLEAYSLIDGKIRPEGSLEDLQQHWQAVEAVVVALQQCWDDSAELRTLVLRTNFSKQLMASAAAALQRVAAAGPSVGPEEPALATAARLTGAIALLFRCYAVKDCQPKIVDAVQNGGENSGQQVADLALF